MTAHRIRPPRALLSTTGFTFLELAIALLVMGVLAPPLGVALHKNLVAYRLEQAREQVVELLTTARWTALATGGASVRIEAESARATLLDRNGREVQSVRLPPGLSIRLSRDRPMAEVRYGPLGLGIVSSQTVRFVLGRDERRLVVSSLGRVDRR